MMRNKERTLDEKELLFGNENMYGIYQIADGTPGRQYLFMDMSFIEKNGYQIRKADYELVYADKLGKDDTLESLFEKFNSDRPTDFTGHSLSVSDVIVINENGTVRAFFTDSISFQELPDFLQLESYLEYFAAECLEFHELGVYFQSHDLNEIFFRYQEILDDLTKSYGGNGMGIIYRKTSKEEYDGTEVVLVKGKSIRGDHLDDVKFIASTPILYEVLDRIRERFPDFRYYPPKDHKVKCYPEKMTADELAFAVHELAKGFDFYDYQDNFDSEADLLETVAMDLCCGKAYKYISYLKDIVDEKCGQSAMAEELLEKLKVYQPEVPEGTVPVVWVNFCEDERLQKSGYWKLSDLDKEISKMDTNLSEKTDKRTGMPHRTMRMYFTIYYPEQYQMKELKGKILIGDGNGGLVNQLKVQNEIKAGDEIWLAHQKSRGDETFQAYMEDLTDMRERVLPYLQSFCSLEEKAPERQVETVAASKAGNKTVISGRGRMEPAEAKRKSIHERIQINKKIIAKQREKGSKENG